MKLDGNNGKDKQAAGKNSFTIFVGRDKRNILGYSKASEGCVMERNINEDFFYHSGLEN